MFNLMFITNNPDIASFVVAAGVNRVFLDLEIIGKVERQGHLNTVISRHKAEDISILRQALPLGSLLVRLNPVHPGTEVEVNDAIQRGADMLMLPMFHGPEDVQRFCKAVNNRVKVCLLVETVGAMKNLDQCIRVPGVDEVHIGLNDLHLEMNCRFMFEPLVDGHVERMAEILRAANIPFGIGGVARVGEGLLPAELILAEHARLGSSGAIISRTFHRLAKSVEEILTQMDFRDEVCKLRSAYQSNLDSGQANLAIRHEEIKVIVASIASKVPPRPQKGASVH